MSRYRKIIVNEVELPEVSGTRFVIYPTVAHKMEVLELLQRAQVVEERDVKDASGKVSETVRVRGKNFDINMIAKLCAKMAFEGCFEHDVNGNRVRKKSEEKDTTEADVLAVILASDVMALYMHVMVALDIISKEKADEIALGMGDAAKKQ